MSTDLFKFVQLWIFILCLQQNHFFRVLTAGDMKVRRDPRLDLIGTDLVIKKVELEDKGDYDCEVESDREVPVSIRHSLDILYPPTVDTEPQSGSKYIIYQ